MLDLDSAPWRKLYPFGSQFLSIDGCRYHYVDEGEGAETLLFVHGNPTWSFHWRNLVGKLSSTFRCVAVDHLGCGPSELQPRPLRLEDHLGNLSILIDELDLKRITLVAQDWGGAIGIGAMLKSLERCERIALFNTGAFPPWFIPWRIRVCRWPILGQLAVRGANAFSLAALRMTLARRPKLDPLVAEAYLAPYYDWEHRGAVYQFVKDIPATPQHPSWETLEQIEFGLKELADLPILLIWGMQDWCFTPACLEKFCEHWPAAEVHRIEGVGHWVVEDAPSEAMSILSDWLERTALVSHGEANK